MPIEAAEARQGAPVLIQHATVMTASGDRFEPGYVLMNDGEIAAVGEGDGPAPPAGAVVVDARGKFVTPGIIDPHSHMGVSPVPDTEGHDDVNELTDPITAGLRVEHSFWPEDAALERAVAGGVTTIGVLPGSGNLIGGRGVVDPPAAAPRRARHALPGLAGDPQDGVRREPEARLRRAEARAEHPDGQRPRAARGVHPRAQVRPRLGAVGRATSRSAARERRTARRATRDGRGEAAGPRPRRSRRSRS